MSHLVRLGNTQVPILWLEFFRFFFRWSDERIAQWTTLYEADLVDVDSCIYHDSLLRPIVGLLIPNAVLRDPRLSGIDKVHLAARIGNAIAGENAIRDPTPGWDWEGAGERVDAILSEYGCSRDDIDTTFRRYDSFGIFVPVDIDDIIEDTENDVPPRSP